MNTMECIKTRRSCRAFTPQKIAKEDLITLTHAARHAPSGMNKQSFQFTVVANQQKIEMLCSAIGQALG